jgi:hypothetical protein
VKRPSFRDVFGWVIGLWAIVAVILFMARIDPSPFRSADWYLGPAVVFGIHQAWSHRTSDLPRIVAWAIGGAVACAAVFVGADALATLIRPWARTQPWLDTALIVSAAVLVAATAAGHVRRASTARDRWISLAEVVVVPTTLAGLWLVWQLGPLTMLGIVLAVGGPITMYALGRLRTRDPSIATAASDQTAPIRP